MSFVQTSLYYIPTYVIGILMVLISIGFSVIGLILVRMIMPVHKTKLHNDIAGPIFATIGVIYAVLVAFMVVISWQNFDGTMTRLETEANIYADLYRDSTGISKEFHAQVGKTLGEYVKSVVRDEWPLMAKGMESKKSHDLIHNVWEVYINFEPKGEREKIFFAESVSKLNEANELRRRRIVDSRTGIHPVLWFVLIACGIITISFTFFFGTENFTAQLIMTGLLASLIALVLFTIMVFDYPFTGDISVSSDVFKLILSSLKVF
ncbi:MAG: DUF4239 domain-containing protein [Candidatus Margulisiibacteriota bacterium]